MGGSKNGVVGEGAVTCAEAVEILMQNGFVEAEALLAAHREASPRHALLYAQIAFARGVLSLASNDLEGCLTRCWDANAQAEAASPPLASSVSTLTSYLFGSGSPTEPQDKPAAGAQDDAVNRFLVRAESHLMGAVMQLLLGRYLKAAWNIRAGWNLYKSAKAEADAAPPGGVSAWVRCLVDFGIGMFNLIVSLLPPTYLSIAELAGFAGSRAEALALLNRSSASGEFWAPFSCLLLLCDPQPTPFAPCSATRAAQRRSNSKPSPVGSQPCPQRCCEPARWLAVSTLTPRRIWFLAHIKTMYHFAGTSTRSSRRTWGWTPRSTRRPRARCSRRKWCSATSARRSLGGCEARAPRLDRAGGGRSLFRFECRLRERAVD
jgi:hypothetical protein